MTVRPLHCVVVCLLLAAGSAAWAASETVPYDKARIAALMRRVADWQLQYNVGKKADPDWIRANFYYGVMATNRVTGDAKYLDETFRWARDEGQWVIHGGPSTRPAKGRRFADHESIGEIYIALAKIKNDPTLYADFAKAADELIEANAPGRVEWWWCDALNMAPPGLVALAVATGERKYFELNDRLYWDSVEFLYDKDEKLFYRDAKQFNKRVRDHKLFWARGNGWVVGGLTRLLGYLPADHPSRPKYEALFRDLCTTLAPLQGSDGLWRSNLLAPEHFPNPETSGSTFYVFAMAYGVNSGLLDRAMFEPIVRKGWAGLVGCIWPDGMLGWVQGVAAAPGWATAERTREYAQGAFLMAAEQVIQLYADAEKPTVPLVVLAVPSSTTQPATKPTTVAAAVAGPEEKIDPNAKVHAMFVPQRLDDFAWENDKVAFRAYGPALLKQDGPQSGIDIWMKGTPKIVQPAWYKSGNYHKNHSGEGLDGYHVGTNRGVGGTAVIYDDIVFLGANYTKYNIIENGPDRVVFELEYAPIECKAESKPDSVSVTEKKRITLEAGSQFNKIESTFTFDGPPIEIGVGLKLHPKGKLLTPVASPATFVAEWEPVDADPTFTGTGLILPGGVDRMFERDGQVYALKKVESGKPITYYAGGGWSAAGFADEAAWLKYVKEAAEKLAK